MKVNSIFAILSMVSIRCISLSFVCQAEDIDTLTLIRDKAENAVRLHAKDDHGQLYFRQDRSAPPRAKDCPGGDAFNRFKHQIAYQRTQESDPLRGARYLKANVWQRGPLTAFYINNKLTGVVPNMRLAYLFDGDGLQGGGTCPVEKNWRGCVEEFAGTNFATHIVTICTITVDMKQIPAWEPSPNDQSKKVIAEELRKEIEHQWPDAREIVIRDFNLKDSQLTIYLKTPDGDYFQGCSFNSMTIPHCGGWHLFGMAPNSSIRQWILERPYQLK